MSYCYFLLDYLPAAKPHKLWFAILSEDRSSIGWTEERPSALDPGAPWVIGVKVEARRGNDGFERALATFLAGGIKDVPPPPVLQTSDIAIKGFRIAFEESFEATAARAFTP